MRVTATIDVYGERIAATAGDRWALAYGAWVQLFDGDRARGRAAATRPSGCRDLRYDGDVLLAAPSRARRTRWEDLPRL